MLFVVVVLAFVGLFIVLSGIWFARFFESAGLPISVLPWLFGWLWFNLFIAVYEVYIVWKRADLQRLGCLDFWGETGYKDFWLKAWAEYACQADRRYLRPSDFVFWIEFGNAVWVVLLWIAFLARRWYWVGILLLIQAYHCVLYFLTWAHSNVFLTGKGVAYLGLSALWIILPLVAYMEVRGVRLRG